MQLLRLKDMIRWLLENQVQKQYEVSLTQIIYSSHSWGQFQLAAMAENCSIKDQISKLKQVKISKAGGWEARRVK